MQTPHMPRVDDLPAFECSCREFEQIPNVQVSAQRSRACVAFLFWGWRASQFHYVFDFGGRQTIPRRQPVDFLNAHAIVQEWRRYLNDRAVG